MGASAYTRDNILKALLRGVAFPLPSGTYISLHTGDPGTTGASEVATGAWPGYARQNAEDGGSIGTGWTVPSSGQSKNSKQITFPSNNGSGSVTVTHFGVWDAASGGNFLEGAALATSRTLAVGDILVFDVNALTSTVS